MFAQTEVGRLPDCLADVSLAARFQRYIDSYQISPEASPGDWVSSLAIPHSAIWHELHMPFHGTGCILSAKGIRPMSEDLAYRVFVILLGLAPVVLTAAAVFMQ